MANVTRSGRKLKDDKDISKRSGKGSSASGSTNSDTSGLRRSTRETPSKKQRSSSPLSIRKSERIEKRTPPTPHIKKSSERVEKEIMPSPLRRSERGENLRSSSSSDSRKSEKNSNLMNSKSKKDTKDNNEKYTTVNARDRNKDEEKERRPVRIVLGKKRLDARTYRNSLLKPQAKKIQKSDLRNKLKEHNETSQGDSHHTGDSSSEEVQGVAECIARNLEELGGEDTGEGSDRAGEGPCSVVRKLEAERSNFFGEIKLSHSSRKRKIHSDEFHESNIGDSLPVSIPKILQSSPGVSAKEAVTDVEKVQLGFSAMENSLKVSTGSISEGRSISGDQCLEKGCAVTTPKRKRKLEDLDSDTSATAANDEIYSSADPVTSAPSESKMGSFLEHCEACSKRQRFEVDSLNNDICSCNYGTYRDSCNNSSPEDEGELVSTAYDHNACVICKLGGKLLCCDGKGCKRNYHLYCLDPPIKAVPHGVWHCFQCIKRKIQFGVHSVSSGVDFICDVREEEVPDGEGIQKQKQYLVKYKGLAHVHNRWFPEHQLSLEAPELVTRLKKNQVLKWKSEWTKPQRLVQKRPLMSPNLRYEHFSGCLYEWLVKWTGLGYEHATWELENAPFLSTPEAITLRKDYETRSEKAILASKPSREKLTEEKKLSSFKPLELPTKTLPGLENDHQHFVNKLYAYWHKNQNAVIVEDQERISKVVLFILSMQSDTCRPVLIISTSNAISAWEAEFRRLAPSVNFVVYSGDKDVRESIRALEFCVDGGGIMLQVLLSPIDAIIEDLEALELIVWEAIIVDECQHSGVSRNFEQIKKLTNGFRLLLLSGPIKESIAEYLNILSFIESGGDRNSDVSLKVDSGGTISKLKERFTRFVVCERTESSKFVEYWVPVRLSNVQLEQYCATLLSNSISLCSYSKNDPVGALRDILISVRKSCDHPYLVDQSLQKLLTKDLPECQILDVGVNASGKLQVLDKILSEIKKRGLRVLIIFQSIGGSGRNCMGDILDDFLRQRFGPDSYERIDSVLVTSKKQAALNMFNNKEWGRFVFLIENRACLPSIKLSSVDMAILFDSDWNPLNDLRALQKITIDSQFEQLKVFRLYSSFTVEEKVLILAKQDKTLESSIQNINPSTSHTLLLWGAYFLFQKLDEFHNGRIPSSGSNILSEQSFSNEVVEELLSQIPNNAEINESKNCENVLKVQLSGASYCKDVTLLGEKEMHPRTEELPHKVWTNLLDGKYPPWKYASEPSQRIRRKVQYFDELPKKPQENEEVVKKRKKVVSNTIDPNTLKGCVDSKRKLVSVDGEGTPGTPTCNGSQNLAPSTDFTDSVIYPVFDQSEMHMAESIERSSLRDSQKNLHLSLKPVILKLCEILLLPNDVRSMVGKFLEYIMNNHNVSREPVTIFQAFQISLCWSAASLLKYKISHKKSLSLAKQHLNFECKEEETDLIYSKMRELKKLFSLQAKSLKCISLENSSPRVEEKHHYQSRASQSTLSVLQELEEGEISEGPKGDKCSIQLDSSKQMHADDSENVSGSSKSGSFKSTKKVEKIHSRRMRKLYQKQMEEFEKFNKNKEKILEKEKEDLEIKHKLEAVLIRSLHNSQLPVRSEKLKMLDQEFKQKKEELRIRMEAQQRKLTIMQRRARNDEKKMRAHWLEEAKSGRPVETYAMQPLSDSGFREENMEEFVSHENSGSGFVVVLTDDCEQGGVGHEKANMSSSPCAEKQDTNGVPSVLVDEALPVEICVTVPDKVVETVGTQPPPLTMPLGGWGVEVNTSISESAADTQSEHEKGLSDTASQCMAPALLCRPLDQEHAALSPDGQAPSFQIPTRDVGLQSREVQNISQVEAQTSRPTDAQPSNLVNDDTPVVPPALQLQLSPSGDEPLTEVPACTSIDQEQTNEFEAAIQATVEGQDVMIDQSDPLPGNQISLAASQRTLAPASDPPASTEQSQPQVPASTRTPLPDPSVDPPPTEESQPAVADAAQRNGTYACLEQFEAQLQSPEESENELFSPLPDNQGRHSAAQPTQAPAQTPAMEQTEMLSPPNSRLSAQSRGHLLPELRSMNILAPHISPASFRIGSDPLENELGRICREEDEASKMHEAEKMRLNFECEKEVQEIQKKYNMMLQDAEVEFAQKKKALETNYNIVYMNRVLAEAFRLKCDSKAVGSSGPQQGGAQHSGSVQQQQQQQTFRVPSPQRPVQMVHQPSALFSSNPVVRSQIGTELRAPAPHLQPFRPMTTSLSPLSAHPHPQQRTPRPSPPTHFSRAENMGGGLRGGASLSALELLMDMERHPSSTSPNPPQTFLPPLQDMMTMTGVAVDYVYLSDDD